MSSSWVGETTKQATRGWFVNKIETFYTPCTYLWSIYYKVLLALNSLAKDHTAFCCSFLKANIPAGVDLTVLYETSYCWISRDFPKVTHKVVVRECVIVNRWVSLGIRGVKEDRVEDYGSCSQQLWEKLQKVHSPTNTDRFWCIST